MVSKAARRYARAFLHTSIEQHTLEKTLEDVILIRNSMEASRDLGRFLKSPVIRPEKKIGALKEIFGERVEPPTLRFLLFLVEKGRENLLQQIMKGFVDFYHLHAGIQEVTVYSAKSLSDRQVTDLTAALASMSGKTVEMDIQDRPDLLGGVAVRIDDTVIDGSVKNKISRLKSLFTERI